jgi:acetolactate synthase-1/3 small subunit
MNLTLFPFFSHGVIQVASNAGSLMAAGAARSHRTMHPVFARQSSSSSSTSAISYKKSHPHKRHPALTSQYLHPAPPSAEEAVSNILYNTPPIGRGQTKQRHIFNCLVQNEPGVLSRVSGILAGRGFNIDSLVVAKTEVADLSRMTIVLRGESATIEQARRQLEDLVRKETQL